VDGAKNLVDRPDKEQSEDPATGRSVLRNRIERFFNKLKNARRVATRYDKTADSFLAFVLASVYQQDLVSIAHAEILACI
jgi:hypothetical protein